MEVLHHAIVVTGFKDDIIHAQNRAISILNSYISTCDGMDNYANMTSLVSEIIPSIKNDFHSFFIAPYRGKSYCGVSRACFNATQEFIWWLENEIENMNSSCTFVEVSFGSGEESSTIINSSNFDLLS